MVRKIQASASAIAARRRVQLSSFQVVNQDPPAHCSDKIVQSTVMAVEQLGLTHKFMISRAYHDSLFMSRWFSTLLLHFCSQVWRRQCGMDAFGSPPPTLCSPTHHPIHGAQDCSNRHDLHPVLQRLVMRLAQTTTSSLLLFCFVTPGSGTRPPRGETSGLTVRRACGVDRLQSPARRVCISGGDRPRCAGSGLCSR